jgi:hypothetical protein
MPVISILTHMVPVPLIDGRATHTFMSTGDATAAGMSIPRGLGGIANGRGVRTVEPGLAHKACVGSAYVTYHRDQGGSYPPDTAGGHVRPAGLCWGGTLTGVPPHAARKGHHVLRLSTRTSHLLSRASARVGGVAGALGGVPRPDERRQPRHGRPV